MKWAFIDYENIGCLSKVDLGAYRKVVLFLGAKQPKIDLGDKKYDSPVDLVLVQLKATQSNNLDFHLSYYLGKFDSEAPTDVSFEIISNDNGFSPLIAHIKVNGRPCKQVKVQPATDIKNKLITFITSTPKEKRPKKVNGLRNCIATHLGINGNEVAIQNNFNQLVNQKIIKISGDEVEYKC
ncbi:hypothetical protein GCM10011348_17130 [Marinobacterium nitratireducens]|uniref:PIN-like domain-containing protein n=1 Tax=Marinobacterium nitratireducens TaxID=518897 RepID=A0A917ZC02_9GAMM|nr:PIN domain-containing protein [Marinobacterium nitratireducens]GGO80448.1 hypothetical protein GCM10011348_17130 [Marinobacterium nitratireducens]